jgi:hypothetical protein
MLRQRIKTKLSKKRSFENNKGPHKQKYSKQYNIKTGMENLKDIRNKIIECELVITQTDNGNPLFMIQEQECNSNQRL